jgi:hypothetical protein
MFVSPGIVNAFLVVEILLASDVDLVAILQLRLYQVGYIFLQLAGFKGL